MKLHKILALGFLCLSLSQTASAAGSKGLGLSLGSGIPFLSQAGIHYFFNDKFALYGGYNNLSITAGTASASLTMPELSLQFHPFSGSFFVGLGAGTETLSTKASDATTGLEAKIDVTATTAIAKLGWMWGASDGGLWFGMDFSYISPSGSKQTITAPGLSVTDQAYIDALDAAKKFGETAYSNFTFFKLGYLF